VPPLHVGPKVPDVAEKTPPDTVKEHELAIVKYVVVPVDPVVGLGEQPFTV
jgi:hypothetical protein